MGRTPGRRGRRRPRTGGVRRGPGGVRPRSARYAGDVTPTCGACDGARRSLRRAVPGRTTSPARPATRRRRAGRGGGDRRSAVPGVPGASSRARRECQIGHGGPPPAAFRRRRFRRRFRLAAPAPAGASQSSFPRVMRGRPTCIVNAQLDRCTSGRAARSSDSVPSFSRARSRQTVRSDGAARSCRKELSGESAGVVASGVAVETWSVDRLTRLLRAGRPTAFVRFAPCRSLACLYDARVSSAIFKKRDLNVCAQEGRNRWWDGVLGVHPLCTPVHWGDRLVGRFRFLPFRYRAGEQGRSGSSRVCAL